MAARLMVWTIILKAWTGPCWSYIYIYGLIAVQMLDEYDGVAEDLGADLEYLQVSTS